MNTPLALIEESDNLLNETLCNLTPTLDLPWLKRDTGLKKHRNISDYDFLLGWLNAEDESLPPSLALFSKTTGPVFIDFLGGKKNHRRQFGGGKGQPLARAVGIAPNKTPSILDATAGMGGDAFVFASLGCKVQMVERSPIVAMLLRDALERAQTELTLDAKGQTQRFSAEEHAALSATLGRMSLVNADAADYLMSIRPEVEVIYLDPMYPEKKKKAATNKEMAALQSLLGPDMDSEKLLSVALRTAQKRVVVKRPAKADPIQLSNERQPSADIKSPNTRYDLYALSRL